MKKSDLRKTVGAYFPPPMRNVLGRWYVAAYEHMVRPVLGFVFDLKGGRFRVDG